MKASIMLVLVVAVAVSGQYPDSAAPAPPAGRRTAGYQPQGGPTQYEYQWTVNEEQNQFSHQESRQDSNAKGSYTVALPDGRVQKVTYTVNGDGGYVAEVTYEGEARFPEVRPSQYQAGYRRNQAGKSSGSAQSGYNTRPRASAGRVLRPVVKTASAPSEEYGAPPAAYPGYKTASAPSEEYGAPPAAYPGYKTASAPSEEYGAPPAAYPGYKTASAPSEEYGAPPAAYPGYKTASAPSEEYGAPPAAYPAYKTQ